MNPCSVTSWGAMLLVSAIAGLATSAQVQARAKTHQQMSGAVHITLGDLVETTLQEAAQSSSEQAYLLNRHARETVVQSEKTNETFFEDYEKAFLMNRTLNLIEQIYFYTKYRQDSQNTHHQDSHASLENANATRAPNPAPTSLPEQLTTESSRTDPFMERLLEQVQRSSVSQLQDALRELSDTAQTGNLNTGISSLCCPLG